MEESSTYQAILEEGEEKGPAKGLLPLVRKTRLTRSKIGFKPYCRKLKRKSAQ